MSKRKKKRIDVERCKTDFKYFADNFLIVEDAESQVPFQLSPYQKRIMEQLERMQPNDKLVIRKGRYP